MKSTGHSVPRSAPKLLFWTLWIFLAHLFLPVLSTLGVTLARAGTPVPKQVDVVIIGAGLSGLDAAYELKKAGLSYHLIEISPHLGGRVRTVQYREQKVHADSGMEEYWEHNPAVKLLKELKLPLSTALAYSSLKLQKKVEEATEDTQKAYLMRIFKPENYTLFENFQKTKVLPVLTKIRARRHKDIPLDAETLKLKDGSFKDWVLAASLPAQVAEWIRVSVECEVGTSWDRVSALDGIAEFEIFVGPEGKEGQGERSFRVKGGNKQFVDALAKTIGLDHITLNTRVNRVVALPNSKNSEVFFLDIANLTNGKITARHVISTVPLYRLFEVQFDPELSANKREAIASQSWGAYFKAHVFVNPRAKKNWMQDPAKPDTSILPILSDSELGVIYDGNPDQKSGTKILSLLITGNYAEAFNMMPMDKVRPQILNAFDKLWPGITKDMEGMEFYRYHPRAIAAWPPGRSRFDALSDEIRRPENHLYFAGDFTESSHSDGAFFSAARAVKQILKAEKE